MTFKVGDKVVGNAKGYSHRIGDEGVVTDLEFGGYKVAWHDGEYWVKNAGIDLAEPATQPPVIEPATIGKTLTELDVKPGDVVRCVNGEFDKNDEFTCTEIVPDYPFKGERWMVGGRYGRGIFGDCNGLWNIISRAPQAAADPVKPKRMHPDDVATACEQYLRDCGYTMARLDLVTALGAEYSIEPTQRF